ncbi:MAG: hypothetical protein WA840_14725 [Caulobacteraceae bacterium]
MALESVSDPIRITDEERAVLWTAKRDGYVAAELFSRGDFNEDGFVLFGKLEVMCLKGLLRFVDRVGEAERRPGDVRMVFAPTEDVRAVAA